MHVRGDGGFATHDDDLVDVSLGQIRSDAGRQDLALGQQHAVAFVGSPPAGGERVGKRLGAVPTIGVIGAGQDRGGRTAGLSDLDGGLDTGRSTQTGDVTVKQVVQLVLDLFGDGFELAQDDGVIHSEPFDLLHDLFIEGVGVGQQQRTRAVGGGVGVGGPIGLQRA